MKRAISVLLAVALIFSLGAASFAADSTLAFDFKANAENYTAKTFNVIEYDDYTSEIKNTTVKANIVPEDTTFTMTNTSNSIPVVATFGVYRVQESGSTVEVYNGDYTFKKVDVSGKLLRSGVYWSLWSESRGNDSYAVGSNGDMFWNLSESMYYSNNKGLYTLSAGESLTFSLPTDQFPKDTIFTLYVLYLDPSDYNLYWRYNNFVFDDELYEQTRTVGGFNDVIASDYYAEPVQWAVENNITTGTSDTAFSPSQTCTRGQIVTFLYRAVAK